jgi:hypothetical protein
MSYIVVSLGRSHLVGITDIARAGNSGLLFNTLEVLSKAKPGVWKVKFLEGANAGLTDTFASPVVLEHPAGTDHARRE